MLLHIYVSEVFCANERPYIFLIIDIELLMFYYSNDSFQIVYAKRFIKHLLASTII